MTPQDSPGGLWVKNYIWRKQCLPGRWKGHKPSKTGHLIYVMIMGMLISKGKAIHPKFHPPVPTPDLMRTATSQWAAPMSQAFTCNIPLNPHQRSEGYVLLGMLSLHRRKQKLEEIGKTCPKSPAIVASYSTSMSGPVGSVHSMCLMPKPMLFSSGLLSCNNHAAGKCLFPTPRLQMIPHFFFLFKRSCK